MAMVFSQLNTWKRHEMTKKHEQKHLVERWPHNFKLKLQHRKSLPGNIRKAFSCGVGEIRSFFEVMTYKPIFVLFLITVVLGELSSVASFYVFYFCKNKSETYHKGWVHPLR